MPTLLPQRNYLLKWWRVHGPFYCETSAKDSQTIIASALDNGVNFIDTADAYVAGESAEAAE